LRRRSRFGSVRSRPFRSGQSVIQPVVSQSRVAPPVVVGNAITCARLDFRSRADAPAFLLATACSPGAFQSSPSSLPSLPSSSQHVLVRGPASRDRHTMSSDEPFHSLFTATDSIDGIWPFLQSVSLARPFSLSFPSSSLFSPSSSFPIPLSLLRRDSSQFDHLIRLFLFIPIRPLARRRLVYIDVYVN